MSMEEEFDSFYRSTRVELTLQALLLTGDLTAAASAVKDAYAITWQHWRKVNSLGEPIDHTRPLSWRLAARRHTGRIWHRNKGLRPADREVLDAIHQLGTGERRAVLLVDVAGVAPDAAARELAASQVVVEGRVEAARATLTGALGAQWLGRVRSLTQVAETAKLPRTQTIQRAGRDRARVIAVGSVVGAVALTGLIGAVARAPQEDRDTAAHHLTPVPSTTRSAPGTTDLIDPAKLLEPVNLSTAATPKQTWTTDRTDPNTHGDGINMICQTVRFADPRGLAALVRTFEASGKPARTAVQTVEVSRTAQSAHQTYNRTLRWFAQCTEPRLMLARAYQVTGVGEEATILKLTVAGAPRRAYDVGVVRTGALTTTTLVQTTNGAGIEPRRYARVLAAAATRLCATGQQCVTKPTAKATDPPRSGEERGFLATVDLPPVGKVKQPWVGVPSVNTLGKVDRTTRCDRANFKRAGATRARARTWLIPEARLPDTFGLTQTYARFASQQAAQKFLASVRESVAGCEDRDLTATVTQAHRHDDRRQQESSWRFVNKVSDKQSVPIRVGFVRSGDRVARLVFIPAAGADMTPADFQALVVRAGARLRELK